MKERIAGLQLELTAAQLNRPTESQPKRGHMDSRRLISLLTKLVGEIKNRQGTWLIHHQEVPMFVLTSEKHDRMRIMAVVSEETTLEPQRIRKLMEANFDRTLDARYALYQGKLWSVYLHPLSTITEVQLTVALNQVAKLVQTYGTTCSSSHSQFR